MAAEPASAATESVLSRFLITPALCISFLVSLLYIDRQTYSQVVAGHVSPDTHYHSHQRKIAKREVEDAFHLRNRALAALLIAAGLGMALVGYVGSKVYHALFAKSVA